MNNATLNDNFRKDTGDCFGKSREVIESFSADKIHIAEYNENGTSYLLKSINFENKTCNIEIRRSQGKVVETIPFDDSKVFTIYHSGEPVYSIMNPYL